MPARVLPQRPTHKQPTTCPNVFTKKLPKVLTVHGREQWPNNPQHQQQQQQQPQPQQHSTQQQARLAAGQDPVPLLHNSRHPPLSALSTSSSSSSPPRHSNAGCLPQHEAAQATPSHSSLESSMSPGALTAAFISLLKQRATQPSLLGAADQHSSGSAVHEQQQPQQLQHPTEQLLQHAVELSPELQPYQASLILYVCAKCQLQCQQQLLGALLQQLQPQALQHLPPTGLVNAFWALAVLQVIPDPAWLEAFYTASSSCRSSSSNSSLGGDKAAAEPTSDSSRAAETNSSRSSAAFEAFNAHQQVQLLWAAGRLRQQPPPAWLTALLSSLQPKLKTLSPTELTNAMWGLSRIGFRPGRLWLGLWFLASKRAVPYSSPDCLACQAASLAVLRVHLSSGRWAVAFRAAVWQQLPSMQPKHIASLLCGLAKQRSRCPPHWVRAVLLRQLQLFSSSDSSSSSRALSPCRELAATVWALPILLHPTAVPWAADRRNAALLKQLAALSLPLLPSCSVAELVQLAVGFARLGYYPGAHWLKTHENAVAQHRLSLTDVNRWRLQAAVKLLWKDS